MDNFFNPKSVAVIGASNNKSKAGYSLVSNLLRGEKRKVYPVTLGGGEILGLPAFRSVLEIPDDVDLALIAVKAESVLQIVSECGEKNIKNVIVISAGFKETGPEGKNLEGQVSELAKKYGISILGPNCLGIIDVKAGLNASFSARVPRAGKISLLSQSGALGSAFLDWAAKEGVGFSKFISLGNEAVLNEINFLEYLKEDEDTEAILVYLEKVSEGGKLMELLSEITQKKPVVIIKAGTSEKGTRAAASHTGSLAPESSVFEGASRQCGAFTASSLREFFNVAKLLSVANFAKNPVRNLAIVTNGGGPSVVATDLIEASKHLSLADLDEKTQAELKEFLPSIASVGNPVDVIGDAPAERYEKVLEVLCGNKELDGIIVMLTPQMMTDSKAVAEAVARFKEGKLVIPVFMGGDSMKNGREVLVEHGMVNFDFAKDAIEALDILAGNSVKEVPTKEKHHTGGGETLAQMPFIESSKILGEYGLKVAGKFAASKAGLQSAVSELGEGPYAMKALSSAVVHKTDSGAVMLGVSDLDGAVSSWEGMEQKIISKIPEAKIEGMLIQKMEKGREVIIGMKRDATFGPSIIFGLGGILAESIKDTSLRVAPVSKEEALKMIHEIKGIKILEGLRGELSVNFDALAEIITNLSRLALEHPEIREIDLNPVMATGSSATIVDIRLMI